MVVETEVRETAPCMRIDASPRVFCFFLRVYDRGARARATKRGMEVQRGARG